MPQLPADVESAVKVFGNTTRVAIIQSLRRDGAATGAELQRRLGLLPNAVQTHLRVLEEHSVVLAHPSRADESGPVTRRYGVDAERVHALVTALSRLVS